MTETLRTFPSDAARELSERARRLADDLSEAVESARHRMSDGVGTLRDDLHVDRLTEAVESLRDELRRDRFGTTIDDGADRVGALVDDLRDAGDDARERLTTALGDLADRVRADRESFLEQLDVRLAPYTPVRRSELAELTARVEAAERAAARAAKKATAAEKASKGTKTTKSTKRSATASTEG
ncbi:MAG TPA: hypothetical protein VK866_04890 [Acidimicrobiales bacterium]|nr:hypothetical protein [Acidimicrobiales bacterium]